MPGLAVARRGRGAGGPRSRVAPCERRATTSRVPSGDHSKPLTPRGRSVRRRASPPSSGSRWTWVAVLAVLRPCGAVRLLLDERPAVREEGERAAVRREARDGGRGAAPRVSWRGGAPPSAVGTSQSAVAVAVVAGATVWRVTTDLAAVGRRGAARWRCGGGRGRRGGADGARDLRRTRRDDGDGAKSSRATIGPRCPTSSRCGSRPTACPDLPDLRPMLPRPLPEAFDSDEHLFEPWWGGRRALVVIGPADVAGSGEVRVVDADGADLSAALPELAGLAVRVAARSAILDGELVVVDAAGRADAGDARGAAGRRRAGRPAAFLAFDLLDLDGRSLLPAARPPARDPRRSCGRATRSSRCRPSRPRAGALRRGGRPGHRRDPGPPADEPVPAGGPQPSLALRGGHPRGVPRRGPRARRATTVELPPPSGRGPGPGVEISRAAARRRAVGRLGQPARTRRGHEGPELGSLAVQEDARPRT